MFEAAFVKYVAPYFQSLPEEVPRSKAAHRFLAGLQWIHCAPTKDQVKRATGLCYTTLLSKVYPLLEHLADVMNEVHWEDRLHEMNHTATFPSVVTTVVDTAFVAIADCRDRDYAALFFSGKYHATGVKLEVTSNLMGHIVDFEFPCALGGSNDHTIHNARVRSGEKRFLDWELCLGDGIYFGADHILAKFPRNYNDVKLRRGGHDIVIKMPLTPEQAAAGREISHDRQRIEHTVGLLNRHRLFRQAWSGHMGPLTWAMHVTCHLTNMKVRMLGINGTAANGYSRYSDVIGPWPHDGN